MASWRCPSGSTMVILRGRCCKNGEIGLRRFMLGAQQLRFCVGGPQKMGSWRCQLHFLTTSSYLEASWVHLGRILGPSWAILRHFGGHLGAILGHVGFILGWQGPSWRHPGPSGGHPEPFLGHLGPCRGHLGGHIGPS